MTTDYLLPGYELVAARAQLSKSCSSPGGTDWSAGGGGRGGGGEGGWKGERRGGGFARYCMELDIVLDIASRNCTISSDETEAILIISTS